MVVVRFCLPHQHSTMSMKLTKTLIEIFFTIVSSALPCSQKFLSEYRFNVLLFFAKSWKSIPVKSTTVQQLRNLPNATENDAVIDNVLQIK